MQDGRTYDENEMKDDEIEIPVQINGKTKAVISIAGRYRPKTMQSRQVKRQSLIN